MKRHDCSGYNIASSIDMYPLFGTIAKHTHTQSDQVMVYLVSEGSVFTILLYIFYSLILYILI